MAKNILIVDDDSITRRFLTFLLRSEGFDVIDARDGIEALEKIALQDVDLVITDLNMPRMDGAELIRNIRSDVDAADLPVFMLTTEAEEESREMSLSAGASEYIVKPVSRETLTEKIHDWIPV